MSISPNPATKERQPFFQVLSLDVVIGTLSVGIFCITVLQVQAETIWWVILPLIVWLVYTLDHLADGLKKRGKSTIYRHLFHYQNRMILLAIACLTGLIAGLGSLLYLDNKIILGGLGLSLLVIIYEILVWQQDKLKIKYIQKEMFIAVIYITGILLAPAVWYGHPFSASQYFIFGILILLAWSEGVIISFFDYAQDKTDGLKSFATVYGKTKTRYLLIVAQIIIIVLVIIGFISLNDALYKAALGIELLMCIILFCLIYFNTSFISRNYFRWIGELVFFLPAFIILF